MRKLLVLFLSCMMVQLAIAQDRTVSGTITNTDDGETIIGVQIVVKGTQIGTITDIDGKYVINVPEGYSTLVYSYVGMSKQNIEVGASNSIVNVSMEPDYVQLDKVVVTAIGIAREKRELGYASQEVGGEALSNSKETNLVSALSGKVAGVQITKSSGSPGGSASIKIRGNASITGDNDPLFIVDGIPIDNAQNYSGNPEDLENNLTNGVAYSNRAIDINPDDIESVNVLKGPAATALYGLRAANGVVVITTKKGARPNTGRGVSVTYNTSIGIDKVSQLPSIQNKYSQGFGGDYGYPSTAFIPSAVSWGALIDTLYYDGSNDNIWDANGLVVGASSPDANIKMTPYDNLGSFWQTGMTYDNHLSFSGGGGLGNYYFSLGNSNTSGIVPNSDFSRTTLKFTADANITNKVKNTTSATYIRSGGERIQQGSNTSGVMLGLLRTPPSFDNANGLEDPVNDPLSYTFLDGSQRNYRGGGGYDNPYWTVNNSPFNDKVDRMIAYTQFDYSATDWLSFLLRVGSDFYSDKRTQFFDIGSRTASAGRVFNDEHFNNDFNSDIMAIITKDLSDNFNARVTIGQNMFSRTHRQVYVQGDGLSIPGFSDISNASTLFSRELLDRKRTAAIYTDIMLSYDNFVYVNLTGRTEQSTTLPIDNNRFNSYAISLGFDITEAFDIASDVFSYGKLRASYGSVGSDADFYQLYNTYQSANYGDGWTDGVFYPIDGASAFTVGNQLGSVDLKPENTSSYEIGADLRFIQNRVGLDVTYYSSSSKDQILPVPISASSGFTTAVLNAGEVENKGIEAVLDVDVLRGSGFNWNVGVNFSRNRNKVVSLAEGVETIFLNGFTGTSSQAVVGEAYGVIFGGRWLRNDGGDLIIGADGYPQVDPEEGVIGDPNPDYLMGVNTALSWKGVRLTGLLDVRSGGDMWNGTKGALSFFGASQLTADNREITDHVFPGVMADGSANTMEVPLNADWYLGNGGGFGDQSEDFIESAGWVRLREVTLSYDLPRNIVGSTPFANIGVYFTGINLWLSTDYDGIDPETNLTGASNGFGLEYFNMPNTKSYVFGLSITY